MTWVLIIAIVWLLLGALIAVPVARTIKAADQRDQELARLMWQTPPPSAAGARAGRSGRRHRRPRIAVPPPSSDDDGGGTPPDRSP